MKRDRVIYSLLLILCIIGFWLFENFYTPAVYSTDHPVEIGAVFPKSLLPAVEEGELVVHQNYLLSYNEAHEQAAWVAYRLDKNHLTYTDRKRPYFEEDPKVSTKSADWRNYKGSGYDRGHLCPAGDRRYSEQAYNETFYTSNISPQNKAFNAGIWNDLEQQVRRWAKQKGTVYVLTGGVLENNLPGIGDEDVSVPDSFYKIVVSGSTDNPQILAFLFPHRDSKDALRQFLVPVDEVEARTGIDFFPELPDELENRLESKIVDRNWKFR